MIGPVSKPGTPEREALEKKIAEDILKRETHEQRLKTDPVYAAQHNIWSDPGGSSELTDLIDSLNIPKIGSADADPPPDSTGRAPRRTVTRRSTGSTNKNEVLRYPYEALTEESDYLQISIVDYSSLGKKHVARNKRQNKETSRIRGLMRNLNTPDDRGRQITSSPFNVSNNKHELTRRSLVRNGTIILPMPDTIVDGNTVSYADSSMNALTAIGLDVGGDFMKTIGEMIVDKKSPEEITNTAVNLITNAGVDISASLGGSDGIQDIITKKLSTMLVGQFGGNVSVNQLLARQDGVIFNPNKELLFNGVNLRNFNFQFKFIPRNDREAEQVEKIIKSFKRNMAPVVAQEYAFLNTPSVFELSYRKGHGEHPFLHKFKQCFLENCTVNYTGDGFYSTYSDGRPVSMTLNLTFKEIEPIYDIDYDNSGLGVGY